MSGSTAGVKHYRLSEVYIFQFQMNGSSACVEHYRLIMISILNEQVNSGCKTLSLNNGFNFQ